MILGDKTEFSCKVLKVYVNKYLFYKIFLTILIFLTIFYFFLFAAGKRLASVPSAAPDFKTGSARGATNEAKPSKRRLTVNLIMKGDSV